MEVGSHISEYSLMLSSGLSVFKRDQMQQSLYIVLFSNLDGESLASALALHAKVDTSKANRLLAVQLKLAPESKSS